MQVTTDKKIRKHHEAVIPNYRWTRSKKPISSASHTCEALYHSGTECSRDIGCRYSALSANTVPRTSVPAKGWQAFHCVRDSKGATLSAPFCNIASEEQACNVEESEGGTMLSEPFCNIASEGRTCNAKGRRGKSSVSAPLWNIASEERACNVEER